ncbi:hypothetical protein Q4555_05110 [Octadecabacter sp. 1_MG-2023]|uniref:hypothetical protein n=1 Tax=unclassified Octadecabacter TaxID=196158 RepID=UPI001C09F4DD|nr:MULTISPECIES: hypothetical protein [unclassified Octadecabacter]MBU2994671.1 hypothetical protein [Octadecabacter sp. B2R22]MDO6734035.1 hypothetical protein [Octadecabacter sp. 1_MG-2023]
MRIPKTCDVTLVKHVPHIDGTAPKTDADRVSTDDVPTQVSSDSVTGKLAKYLDLLDTEMAEHWAQNSAV